MTDFNIRRTQNVDIEYTKGGQKVVETFTITEFNAESGLKYAKTVQKIVAPIYAEFIAAVTKYKQDNTEDQSEGIPPEVVAVMMRKASEALAELNEKDAIAMVCEAISIPPTQFNNKFNGKLICFAKLLKEVVMFNFEDVFIELGLGEILYPVGQ